jgi:hypothetical protein
MEIRLSKVLPINTSGRILARGMDISKLTLARADPTWGCSESESNRAPPWPVVFSRVAGERPWTSYI